MFSPFVSFHHFYHKIGEQVRPHSFLNSSLKRLYIQLWDEGAYNLNLNVNARNATWLLIFCRRIEMASLGFQMSVEDSRYLSEFAETFAGLSSVKKLAIKVHFVYKEEEKKTWWGGPEEEHEENLKGGSRKNESIINFLQSTNKLDALEIYVPSSEVRDGDYSQVSLNCLTALPRSFQSLRHLRLLGAIIGEESLSLRNPYSFQVLRVLTLDWGLMYAFSFLDLPQSIEILCLPHYLIRPAESAQEDELEELEEFEEFEEDKLIRDMIDHEFQPGFDCLKEVVVPSRPIGPDGEHTDLPHRMTLWSNKRRELERANVFRSGKVKLTTLEVG